jgi:hypothetical protein
MTSFLHISTNYHGLEYFISKHVLIGLMQKKIVVYHDYIMTFKYRGIQIL